MIIGITGISGCGKSTLIEALKHLDVLTFRYTFSYNEEKDKLALINPRSIGARDDLDVIMYFLNQRIRMFFELRQKYDSSKYDIVVDRWWLDTILNTNKIEVFNQFYNIYRAPFFDKDFLGIYIDIKPKRAYKRKKKYTLNELKLQYEQFKIAIRWLKRKRYSHLHILDGETNIEGLIDQIENILNRKLYQYKGEPY